MGMETNVVPFCFHPSCAISFDGNGGVAQKESLRPSSCIFALSPSSEPWN